MADERPPLPDFYAVLGIGFDATNDELRQAWRTAVKQWHPDTNPSPEAHGMMARINEAWEVLGDPERRAEYDTLYFTLRAAIANAERKQREEERLERQRHERIRKQELERQQREAEAARQRLLEQERRRAEQERKERERREAEARRKANLERMRRDQERINSARKEQEIEESAHQPEASGDGRGKRGGVSWAAGFIVVLPALVVVVAIIGYVIWVENQSGAEQEAALIVPTAVRPTAAPTPTTTVAVNQTPRSYVNNSESWRSTTPVPTAVHVAATPTATPLPTPVPRPDFIWLDSIQPGSVHEYLLLTESPTGAEVRRMIAAGAEFGYIQEIGFGTLFLAAGAGADSDVFAALLEAGDNATRSPDLLHTLLWGNDPTLGAVQELIDAGASLSYEDFAGRTPADIAIALFGSYGSISRTLTSATEASSGDAYRQPTESRSGNFDRFSPIIHEVLTSSNDPLGSLHIFIYIGAPLTASNFDGRTVLETAAFWRNEKEVFSALLAAGADPRHSPTVIHELLRGFGFSMDVLRFLIDKGAPLHTKDEDGNTALEVAEIRGHSDEVIQVLVSAGAQPRRVLTPPTRVPPTPTAAPRPRFQGSPTVLHNLLGGASFSVDALRVLVDAGAPLDTQDYSGRTVLEVAALWGRNVEVFDELISAGADPRRSPTVLHNLLGGASFSMNALRVLIDAGAPLDTHDYLGRTVLESAAFWGRSVEVFDELISAGADPRRSPTVLHNLLGGASFSMNALRVLIDAGAPLDTHDYLGRTVLDVAAARGHGREVMELLLP